LALKNLAQLVLIAEMAPLPLAGSEEPPVGAELDDEEDDPEGVWACCSMELPPPHPASANADA